MTSKKLTIPKKINVGFQERGGTYTGKLAYVIYTDVKGVLRKETSWQSWRDKKIDPKDFDNVPTSGFVLNKKAGDTRYGWNQRRTWVRVWDPRDFEFEISVANLLFILEETSSIKGKGLEGEFVYGWDGSDLVLLPVSAQEYKSSVEYTDLQSKKITAKEVKEGAVYTTKDNEQYIYLGKHNWYAITTVYGSGWGRKEIQTSKKHVFVSTDGQSKYWTTKDFSKLAVRVGEDISPQFAEEFDKFKKSDNGSPPLKILGNLRNLKEENLKNDYYGINTYIKEGDKFYPAHITKDQTQNFNNYNPYAWDWNTPAVAKPTLKYILSISSQPVEINEDKVLTILNNSAKTQEFIGSEVGLIDFYSLVVETESGNLIEL